MPPLTRLKKSSSGSAMEREPEGGKVSNNKTITITLTGEQLEVILEAIQSRIAMGGFELNELGRIYGGVAVDAIVSTRLRVDKLVGVLDVLTESES